MTCLVNCGSSVVRKFKQYGQRFPERTGLKSSNLVLVRAVSEKSSVISIFFGSCLSSLERVFGRRRRFFASTPTEERRFETAAERSTPTSKACVVTTPGSSLCEAKSGFANLVLLLGRGWGLFGSEVSAQQLQEWTRFPAIDLLGRWPRRVPTSAAGLSFLIWADTFSWQE